MSAGICECPGAVGRTRAVQGEKSLCPRQSCSAVWAAHRRSAGCTAASGAVGRRCCAVFSRAFPGMSYFPSNQLTYRHAVKATSSGNHLSPWEKKARSFYKHIKLELEWQVLLWWQRLHGPVVAPMGIDVGRHGSSLRGDEEHSGDRVRCVRK